MQVNVNQLHRVTIYDPARSRESEYHRLARHAILTAGMDWDYNIYVLDAWAERCSLDNVLVELERQCELWHPDIVGVESTAAQAAVADICYTWIQMNHKIAPLYMDLIPDTRVNKKWRIRMEIQRVAPYGKLYLLDSQYELRTELLALPNGRTIDLCDVLAYAIQLLNPPSAMSATRSADKFAARRRHDQGFDRVAMESDDPFSPLSRVPRVRTPPSDNSIVLRRVG